MSTSTSMPGVRHGVRPSSEARTVSPISTPDGAYEGAPDRLGASLAWPALIPVTLAVLVGAMYALSAMAH